MVRVCMVEDGRCIDFIDTDEQQAEVILAELKAGGYPQSYIDNIYSFC